MIPSTDFQEFPKIARLSREAIITEKIDGTNAQVMIVDSGLGNVIAGSPPCATNVGVELPDGHHTFAVYVGSRNRWITPTDDNFGFARWVADHAEEIVNLGPGRHFGEWWGSGIQRGYGLRNGEKRWSLFNTARWHLNGAQPHVWKQNPRSLHGQTLEDVMSQELPACVGLVPVLWSGPFSTRAADLAIEGLLTHGSAVAPGFNQPEGIVVFHTAANLMFKKTLERDDAPKSQAK